MPSSTKARAAATASRPLSRSARIRSSARSGGGSGGGGRGTPCAFGTSEVARVERVRAGAGVGAAAAGGAEGCGAGGCGATDVVVRELAPRGGGTENDRFPGAGGGADGVGGLLAAGETTGSVVA